MSNPEAPGKVVSRGGRPTKGGGPDAVPVNLRLSRRDHDGLADVAAQIRVSGRPALTVQDVLRRLVRGALSDPETLRRLVDAGRI